MTHPLHSLGIIWFLTCLHWLEHTDNMIKKKNTFPSTFELNIEGEKRHFVGSKRNLVLLRITYCMAGQERQSRKHSLSCWLRNLSISARVSWFTTPHTKETIKKVYQPGNAPRKADAFPPSEKKNLYRNLLKITPRCDRLHCTNHLAITMGGDVEVCWNIGKAKKRKTRQCCLFILGVPCQRLGISDRFVSESCLDCFLLCDLGWVISLLRASGPTSWEWGAGYIPSPWYLMVTIQWNED